MSSKTYHELAQQVLYTVLNHLYNCYSYQKWAEYHDYDTYIELNGVHHRIAYGYLKRQSHRSEHEG